jgi:hypothetical protein
VALRGRPASPAHRWPDVRERRGKRGKGFADSSYYFSGNTVTANALKTRFASVTALPGREGYFVSGKVQVSGFGASLNPSVSKEQVLLPPPGDTGLDAWLPKTDTMSAPTEQRGGLVQSMALSQEGLHFSIANLSEVAVPIGHGEKGLGRRETHKTVYLRA